MSMSFSVDFRHISRTHKHLIQWNFRAAVEGMFLLSVSTLCHIPLRIICNHISCFSTILLAVTEW